jgi:hypothetical protein
MVPCSDPELLSTPYGLLVNELSRSPTTVLRAVLALLRGALACDTGSVVDTDASTFNSSATIILYVIRLCARVENYVSFLVNIAKGRHACLVGPLRGIAEMSAEVVAALSDGLSNIRELLDGPIRALLDDYLRRLDGEVKADATNEKLIDRNSRLACDLHSHKLILYRNYHEFEM